MYKKIDHVGIAVPNLEESIKLYQDLGFEFTGREIVEEQGVETAFFRVGESNLELLGATNPDSPIAKYIKKNGDRGGIQHIAVGVDDVEAELSRLKEKGYRLIDEVPKVGAHGAKIAFLHPKSTSGVLLELCQK